MIRPEDVALILMAAGRSRRFGVADKLREDLDGRPVGMRIADTLAAVRFGERVAVIGDGDPDYGARGYRIVRNDRPGDGMSRSVALGTAAVRDIGVRAVLVCLADMPLVTVALIRGLLDAAQGEDAVVAATDGIGAKPPALFGKAHFATLTALTGEWGARDLIRGGRHVVALSGELIDIDTPADLAAAAALIRGAARRSD